jgi:CheY-like chemotaxis protein
LGYQIIEADSGFQAIERFSQANGKVDLLLTDVVMPGMGGRDLAQELRRNRPDLPVIYLSGYTDDAVIQRGVSEESDVLIQKPFTAQVLARKIRRLLDDSQG